MPTPPAGSSSWGLAARDPEPLWYAARASAPDSGPPTPAEASRSGAGALRPAEAITGCRCGGTLVGLGPEMRRYASAGDGVSPQLLYLPWEFLRRRPRCGPEGRIFESCWARQDFTRRLGGLATGAFPSSGRETRSVQPMYSHSSGPSCPRLAHTAPGALAGRERLAVKRTPGPGESCSISKPVSEPGRAAYRGLSSGPSMRREQGSEVDRLTPCSTKAARSDAE